MDEIFIDLFKSVQDSPMIIAPVVVVFIGAILVYVLGFKKPVEPQFKKFDSKKDKRKVKAQKLTINGNLYNTEDSKTSESKKKDIPVQNTEQPKSNATPKKQKRTKKDSSPPAKQDKKQLNIEIKQASPRKGKIPPTEKVSEADEGEWMTVTKDKKKKQEEPLLAQLVADDVPKKSQKKKSPGSKKASNSADSSPNEKPKAMENKKVKKASPPAKKIVDSETADVAISGEPADSKDSVAPAEVTTAAEVKADHAPHPVNNEEDECWIKAKQQKKTKKKALKE